MLRLVLACTVTLSFANRVNAEEEPRPYVKRGFLILASTKKFSEALQKAAEAAEITGLPLNLRGVGYHKGNLKESGDLTFSAETCKESGWEYPCYVARGRFDSGVYLSVEHSSAYQGFAPGYYIVVAASGDATSPEMKKTLAQAKKAAPDAYVKTTEVYVGCMH